MFAVETNIFYPNSIIKELFENVNNELANVTIGVSRINCQLIQAKSVHKQTNLNNIPLKLPDLKFNNIILKRVTELKLLGVMIDKNLN